MTFKGGWALNIKVSGPIRVKGVCRVGSLEETAVFQMEIKTKVF